MMLLRCARDSDADAILQLAKESGVGLTTLPKNKELLKARLNLSTLSFQTTVTKPSNEYYLFVLEDKLTNKLVGTSAIEAKTGHETPFYSYHISKFSRKSPSLNIRTDYEVLSLVNDNQGRTEICTLFLNSQYRNKSNGLLLSKGRFVFMAQHPERFAPSVIAELRGVVNDKEQSPFWEHVGRHFFQMTFQEADQLNLASNKQFIEDLMPQYPLYVPLLAPEAQAAIGKPHHSTIPAMNILVKEGFRFNNYIHIFDGGPTIEAALSDIKTVASSGVHLITGISDEVRGQEYILANMHTNFRATASFAIIHEEDNSCIISKETAELLQVQCNDRIRMAPMHPDKTRSLQQGQTCQNPILC